MQSTLLQVLHAPAHVHGPRNAPDTDAEDGVFGQALTSASDLLDGGLDGGLNGSLNGATAADRTPSDRGETAAQAEDTPELASTRDAPAAASAHDPSKETSLPAWLAGLKEQADRAGAGRSTATATARPDLAVHPARAGAALTTVSRHGPQAGARSAAPGTPLAGGEALAPIDTAPAVEGLPEKARGASKAQGKMPDRADEVREAGNPGPTRPTARALAAADKAIASIPSASVGAPVSVPDAHSVERGVVTSPKGHDDSTSRAHTSAQRAPASAPAAGSLEHGVATSPGSREGGASLTKDAAQRLTVAVEGEKVTIELRQTHPGPAKAGPLAPEATRAVVMPGTTLPAAPPYLIADVEHRPPNTIAATPGKAAQAKGSDPRAKAQDEVIPAGGAPSSPTMTGRTPEFSTVPARSPENPLVTATQTPSPALTDATQPTAALPGAALPVQRLRSGPSLLATGAGDGSKLLAAAADRARLAAVATAGPTDAEAAQRLAGSDAGAAPAAAQASSWLQALEVAVQQAGAEAPHGLAPEATASPGLTPVAKEPGTRLEASAAESGDSPRIDVAPDSPQFPGMLGARVAAMVRDGVEQARIALNPAELGPVSVQIELAGTQVRVDLAAEVEATRIALEQALPALAGSLREAGFTLAGGGVFQQARDGGSGDPASGGNRQDGGSPTTRAVAAEPGPAPRAHRPQGLVDLYA